MAQAEGCPFCGKRWTIMDTIKNAAGEAVRYRNACAICGASTRWYETEDEAAEAWDRRAAPAGDGAEKAAAEGSKRSRDAFINKDLFWYRGAVYARNPQTQYCYRDQGGEGYKRIKKAEYLRAYGELGKKAEQAKRGRIRKK